MMNTSMSAARTSPNNIVVSAYRKLLNIADGLPLSAVQLLSRVAVAHVFWNSAQSKLASWSTTLQLFANEYHVPLLPPDIAAPLATATELTGSVLLFFGLLSRLGALALLGVTATIQLFVYPENWGEHLVWASLLLLIVFKGPGKLSLDHLVNRYFTTKN
jgi:putative oxidoreductase